MHGSNWRSFIRSGDEKPSLSWDLLKRVLTYSRAYRWQLVLMLVLVLVALEPPEPPSLVLEPPAPPALLVSAEGASSSPPQAESPAAAKEMHAK